MSVLCSFILSFCLGSLEADGLASLPQPLLFGLEKDKKKGSGEREREREREMIMSDDVIGKSDT